MLKGSVFKWQMKWQWAKENGKVLTRFWQGNGNGKGAAVWMNFVGWFGMIIRMDKR